MYIKLPAQDIRRYNWYIWRFFITGFIIVVLLIGLTTLGIFGSLPSLRELENPKSDQASEVLSSDGKILGKYYKENRSNVTFRQISPYAIKALLATEDNHFYEHSGIDFWRIFSIIAYNMVGNKQGGSTITQQLALNLFSGEERARGFSRVFQKLKEQIMAVRIERHYTKEEILTMYLNTVDFGSNSFGIASASNTFFNTTPDKLTPDQAAVLIALLKGPTMYSPVRHPDNSLGRRNFVLGRMADEHYLTEEEAKGYQAKPLGLDYQRIDNNMGLAPYFRDVLNKRIAKLFTDLNITKADGTPYDLLRDGLKIYTTIDATMQQYAEEAQREYMAQLQNVFNKQWKGYNIKKNIKNYQLIVDRGIAQSDRHKELALAGKTEEEILKDFNTIDTVNLFTWHGNVDTLMRPIDSVVYSKMLLWNSMMSMDPTTGYIKAWVGGIDHEHFKYDQVYQGKRQVGSTAKPFTYAQAIEDGFSPCQSVPNEPVTIDGWTPKSATKETLPGAITLRTALAFSQNYVTAWVMDKVGPLHVSELIKKMGVTSDVPAYPSICLGTFDASVYDMTGAYSAFVNHGVWTQPTFLLRIEDKNGNRLYEETPKKAQAVNEQTAYVITDMLKSVINDGTGSRLNWRYRLNAIVAGKTGTTQDNSDGWFIGATPKLVTGVWTGCENRDFSIHSTAIGQGNNSALPIFAGYMKRVYANAALGYNKKADFERPKTEMTITLDCNAYSQQVQGTGEVEKKLGF